MGVPAHEGAGVRRLAAIITAAVLVTASSGAAQEARVLIVAGIGGDAPHRALFQEWGGRLRDAFVERYRVPADRVVYLGEKPSDDPARIGDRSTKEMMEAALARFAADAAPEDRIIIVLVGHGTSQGQEARFNLPGPDLAPEDLAVALDAFPTQQVAVVNTASASATFVPALSGPRRAIVTATRTAQERNETVFARFFVQALEGDDGDLDKDGLVSLLEAFDYTTREIQRHYEDENLILTEHALLDDDGDGEGSEEPGSETADGRLASAFVIGASGSAVAAAIAETDDPVLRSLYEKQADLEGQVAALRAMRQDLPDGDYQTQLETLLVELALINREIRELGGGGR